MTETTLRDVDVDGAVGESLAALVGRTRAELLRDCTLGAAGLLAAVAARPAVADARDSDVAILNFALSLEYLQAAFYSEVERMKVLHGELARQARTVGAHERAHVAAFRKVLGAKAIKPSHFDFRGATEGPEKFRRTAVAFEDLAVAAYKGQAPKIHSQAYLAAALGIHAVEARHAAWIRRLAGVVPAPTAFDLPRSRASATQIVGSTHFVVHTSGAGKPPRFMG
jgi:rubrerythrin